MGRTRLGEAHPSAATLAQRLAINPRFLQLFIRRYADDCLELCGYSLLYPLTDRAGTSIVEGQIRSGKELGPETLLPTFANAKYLYIGMLLAAPDVDARSHAKARLRQKLARRISEGMVEFVLARAATSSGQRLMRTHGFVPFGGEEGIWTIPGARLMCSISRDPKRPMANP